MIFLFFQDTDVNAIGVHHSKDKEQDFNPALIF